MTKTSTGIFRLLGILSIWLHLEPVLAQTPTGIPKNNATTYEDDRIKVVVQNCNRKQQDLICQATLTSKNSDRIVNINANNVKLVDFEGNEYYPSLLRLANRTSENNSIRTELVEDVPFKASFVFPKFPNSITKIALLQIQLTGSLDTNAKFRNLAASDLKITKPNALAAPVIKSAKIDPEVSSDNNSICPDNTKILYRAATKHYLMYICGNKNPTHYVGVAKDGSQGIMLRLRYYDRTQFSADNGDTNYTIATDRLIIRKENKVIYRQKLQVLQALPSTTVAESSLPKTNVRRSPTAPSTTNIQKNSSTSRPSPKIDLKTRNN